MEAKFSQITEILVFCISINFFRQFTGNAYIELSPS